MPFFLLCKRSKYVGRQMYWVLVVTRPARLDLVPQAVCQCGKLSRVMIMLSFIDVWHEATLKQIAWAHSFHLDVADDARATPAPIAHKAKGSGLPWGIGRGAVEC